MDSKMEALPSELAGLNTQQLAKVFNAHFQRIIDIRSLVVGKENSVITSSIDRSIKVRGLKI